MLPPAHALIPQSKAFMALACELEARGFFPPAEAAASRQYVARTALTPQPLGRRPYVIKNLHDTVEALAAERAEWNKTLERRVEEQGGQLEQLKRFFSPQLAELIVAGGAEDPLKSHRREVTGGFLAPPGFTALARTAEPAGGLGGAPEH